MKKSEISWFLTGTLFIAISFLLFMWADECSNPTFMTFLGLWPFFGGLFLICPWPFVYIIKKISEL